MTGLCLEGPSPVTTLSTWAFLLVAGLDFLPAALARVALHACPLAHSEAPLPACVASLGTQAPVVPGAPLTIRFGSGEQKEERQIRRFSQVSGLVIRQTHAPKLVLYRWKPTENGREIGGLLPYRWGATVLADNGFNQIFHR